MQTIDVIEDDPPMRTLLLEWLADAGYRVRVHGDLAAPVRLAADVVVVDLSSLPSQGPEAIHEVRDRFSPRVVIGLSTRLLHSLSGESLQARALGLDGLLPKPCSRQALVVAVQRALERAR